jgi:hypothetical protein
VRDLVRQELLIAIGRGGIRKVAQEALVFCSRKATRAAIRLGCSVLQDSSPVHVELA